MWLYEGKQYEPSSEEILESGYQGFVYLITNQVTGRKYVGKKFLVAPKILPKTQTRKRRKRIRVESDWRSYFGSSAELLADVKKYGPENFTREILRFCSTKGDCSYYELKEQIERNVLETDDYYNNYIGGKIHSKHLTINRKS